MIRALLPTVVALVFALALALGGCGQKGPLKLPDPAKPTDAAKSGEPAKSGDSAKPAESK